MQVVESEEVKGEGAAVAAEEVEVEAMEEAEVVEVELMVREEQVEVEVVIEDLDDEGKDKDKVELGMIHMIVSDNAEYRENHIIQNLCRPTWCIRCYIVRKDNL